MSLLINSSSFKLTDPSAVFPVSIHGDGAQFPVNGVRITEQGKAEQELNGRVAAAIATVLPNSSIKVNIHMPDSFTYVADDKTCRVPFKIGGVNSGEIYGSMQTSVGAFGTRRTFPVRRTFFNTTAPSQEGIYQMTLGGKAVGFLKVQK